MTTGNSARFFGCFVLICALLFVIASSAQAVNVTLTADDGFGTSSFNVAGNWDNLAAPTAGNDYFNGNFLLRTPADPNSHTFAGDSLTITSDVAPGANLNDSLMYKGIGATGTISIDTLTFNGGNLRHASGDGDVFNLAGTSLTVGSSGMGVHLQGPLNLSSALAGSGDITIFDNGSASAARTLHLQNSANTFTGNVILNTADRSRLALDPNSNFIFDINGVGVSNSISGAGVANFDGIFEFDLTGASSTPGDSWTVVSAANVTYGANFSVAGSFTQSGSVWTDGTYTFRPTTGTLSVALPTNEWVFDGDGSYSDPNKWTQGTPAADSDVEFGSSITANRTVTLDTNAQLNSITFSNEGDGDYFIVPQASQAITLTGEAKVNTFGRHWMRAELAGTTGLNATGPGELVLDANNSFTGGLTVDNTNLAVTDLNAIPSGNTISVQNSGEVRFWGADNGFFGGTHGTGLDPNSTVSVSGAVSIDATSQLEINDGANVSFSGGIANEGSFEARSGSTVSVGSVISGTGTVNVQGGNLTLSVANSYSGVTNVGTEGTGGTLTITNSDALGAASGSPATQTVIGGNAATATLVLSGGVAVGNELLGFNAREGAAFAAVGLSSANGNNSWAGNIKANTGGSQYNIASADPNGTLTLSGTISAPDSGSRNFVFSGAGDTNITGKITDLETDPNGNPIAPASNAADAVSVYKQGAGTLTISTASSQQDDYWQVATVIEEGTLVVKSDGAGNGELWSQTIDVHSSGTLDVTDWADDLGSPDYNLQPGQNLGGAGTVNVGSGALGVFGDNSLTPGASVGTLNITGNLKFKSGGSGGQLNYELGNTIAIGGSENDLIDVSGAVTTAVAGAYQINVIPVESALATGAYRLISHSGGATDFSASTIQVLNPSNPDPNNPLNPRQTFSVSGATAGQVNLTVSGSAASRTWNGTGGNNIWDVATTSPWLEGDQQFRDLDNVTFGSAATVKNVTVNTSVTPASVNFSGGGGSTYTLSGTGGITGIGPVNVNSGTVQFLNEGNNYIGTTTIASGARLESGSGSTGSIVANGAISLTSSVTSTLVDDFSGDPNTVLANYSNTVILDANGGGSNTAGWQVTSATLEYNTTSYDGIEQTAMIRSGLALSVGEELQVDVSHSAASQDIGLYVGGTTPVTGVRQDYVAVYARNNGQVFSRGFDGTTEYGLTGGGSPAYDKLFIARTDTNTYEAGYYENGVRNIITTRTPTTPNTGDVVGFYTDVRAVGVLGNLDNLFVVEGDPSSVLDVNGDFTLTSTGTLELDISAVGLTSLDISGTATLDGTLSVEFLDGFMPNSGAQYPLVSATGGIVDAGLSFSLPALGTGMFWDTSDFFNTGTLAVDDVDQDNDGLVTARDFLILQRTNPSAIPIWSANYGNSFPLSAAAAAVPEPTSLVLLLVGLCSAAIRPTRFKK